MRNIFFPHYLSGEPYKYRTGNTRKRQNHDKSVHKEKNRQHLGVVGFVWALTDSNRRPSACKADALNQLS